MAAGTITCVVADDHPAVLSAVSGCLTAAGVSVVGRAKDGEEALEQIEQLRPRVALIDVRMPRLGGIELTRQARRLALDTAILLYTGHGECALLTEALDAGVSGFVLKESPIAELVSAVDAVAAGRVYIDPVLAAALAATSLESAQPQLTQRERGVLRLLAEGLANDEIGKELFISAETVRADVRKAMTKLDAGTRTAAVARAVRDHLIA